MFLLAHRGHAITGWLMCLGGLSCAIRVSFQAMALSAMAAGISPPPGTCARSGSWAGRRRPAAGRPAPALLPDGRLPSARWRPFAALAVTTSVLGAALMVARPTSPAGLPVPRPIPSPFAVEALAPYYVMAHKAAQNFLLFFVVVAMASQILRFRRADAAGRRQVAWPLSAFAGYVVLLITGPALWLLAVIWTGLIPVAIVFAALRYRLYGIDTVISRAFVAAGLIAAVSAVYFGAGALTGLLLSGYDRIGGLAAALAAGVFFDPLRARLRRLADRLMYGTHGDPAALAARLTREVGEAEPAGALIAVASVIRDGLGLTGVAVEVDPRRQESHPRSAGPGSAGGPAGLARRAGRPPAAGLPGPRRFAAAYNDRLIAVAAPYAADVAHAIRLTADLQRSRERILTAREEERRRLRRDLHDGLGHALTDMAMSINMAKISLRSAPASADRLLLDLRTGMDSVSQEIKELVYGLRPPTLDELGLTAAVQALADDSGPSVRVQPEGNLSDLPAAVEVAAYRIIQEALTNIRKHARARTCAVSLRRERSALTLRIADDGCGLPERARSGIGLISMRERASELGGTCVVGPAAAAARPSRRSCRWPRPRRRSAEPPVTAPGISAAAVRSVTSSQSDPSRAANDGECRRMSSGQVAVLLPLR
nr:hypothetical protein GCM10020093_111320 [Planobispora longispora]